MVETPKQKIAILYQCDDEINEFYHDYVVRNGCGLSDTAFWLLYIIWDMGDNCTQSDVCSKWFYKRQSINSALKRLEAQGYLTLQAIPGNKKSKHIVLTKSGKSFAEKVMSPLVSAELRSLEAFDEQEMDMLIKLTKKRISSIRKNIMPDITEE